MEEINIQGVDNKGFAKASFIIGISGILLMFIPFINIPAQIVAFILGILGRKSSRKGMAVAGIVLSCIMFIMSFAVSIIAFQYFKGYIDNAKLKTIPAKASIVKDINTYGGVTAVLHPKKADGSRTNLDELIKVRGDVTRRLLNIRQGDISVNIDEAGGSIGVMVIAKKGEQPGDIKDVITMISHRAFLTFQEIDENKKDDNGAYLPTGKIIADNSDILKAQAGQGKRADSTITIEFNPTGSAKFAEATERLIGNKIGIFLDGQLISAPTVQAKITGGKAVVSGQKTPEEARELADTINSGPLPFDFEVGDIKVYQQK